MFDDLLAANRQYAAGFTLGGLPARAAAGFGLVACMDTRIEPLAMLGLQPGDAKILRNAGGRVTPDVLRSLALAATYLGVTRIAVMHHTGCALAGRTADDLRSGLSAAQAAGAQGWDFLAMPDPDGALAADVHAVRTCAALPSGVVVEGWRYDVDTGLVDRVIPSEAESRS
jgi:carbonic anhydrase